MRKMGFIAAGILVTAIGLMLLKHSHVVTGGTAGLSLSLSYGLPVPFALLFFLINLPFYALSFLRMGWSFTVTSIVSVTALSFVTGLLDRLLPAFSVPAPLGALAGGVMIGASLVLLFANNASLGGANILALYLHKRYGTDPGKTTFAFDSMVVAASMYTSLGWTEAWYSVASIAVTSYIISTFKNKMKRNRKQEHRERQAAKAPLQA